jgi:hypothetical protein
MLHYSGLSCVLPHILLYNALYCVQLPNDARPPVFTHAASTPQFLVITSDKVAWAKQGTVTLVDGEPEPPKMEQYSAEEGWKMVRHFVPTASGGDYQFLFDQILVVLRGVGNYKELPNPEDRLLCNLSSTTKYLVWYHHFLAVKDWKIKRSATGRGHTG